MVFPSISPHIKGGSVVVGDIVLTSDEDEEWYVFSKVENMINFSFFIPLT